MPKLEFVESKGAAPVSEPKPIEEPGHSFEAEPDFSDLESELDAAEKSQAETEEPYSWDEHRAEKVPEDIVIDPDLVKDAIDVIGFVGDLACGLANRSPLSDIQKAGLAMKTLNVAKQYPRLFKKRGTPKQRAWAGLGFEIAKTARAKAAEAPVYVDENGEGVIPPQAEPEASPMAANQASGFTAGRKTFGVQK